MASRLADILKQEYKTKGIFSGTTSAIGKSMREKLDIRNALFGGSGLGSVIGRKVFGKGYSALSSDKSKVSESSDNLISASTSILQEININGKIATKNSMALPRIAEQMNIMQKNVAKLVKLQGETPSSKADSFFSNSKFRENAYESTFNKNAKTSPTKVENKSGGTGLFGVIGGLLGSLGNAISFVLKPFSSLSTILLTAVGVVSLFGRGIGKILAFLAGTKIGKILGIGALIAGSSMAFGGNEGGNLENPQPTNTGGGISGGAIVGGAIGAAGVASFASKAGGLVSKTSEAVLDARTTPSNVSYKGSTPSTKWGKFLQFVEKKSPKLFAKVGARLATAGALTAIPVVGWIGALINLGLTLWTAYEIYELWKIFNGENSEETGSSPTKASQEMSVTFGQNGLPVSTQTGPTNVTQQSGGGSYSGKIEPVPAKNDMADLIRKKFKEAGFNDAQAEAAVANAWAESRFDPNAHNTKGEDSVGLFQMNRRGGLGSGHSVENLKDPAYNIDLAIKAAKGSKAFKSATNVPDAVAAFVNDVERPANKAQEIEKRTAMAQNTPSMTSKTELASTGNEKAFVGNKLNMGSRALANQQNGGDTNVSVVNQTPAAPQNNNQQIAVSSPSAFDSELSKFLLKPMML